MADPSWIIAGGLENITGRITRKRARYRGARMRVWGKWVSEIRLPKKKTRVWLGTYPTEEMAARAHDVGAIVFKGKSAFLNFPHLKDSLPRPVSLSLKDVQAAAAKAAKMDERAILQTPAPVMNLAPPPPPPSWAANDADLVTDLGEIIELPSLERNYDESIITLDVDDMNREWVPWRGDENSGELFSYGGSIFSFGDTGFGNWMP